MTIKKDMRMTAGKSPIHIIVADDDPDDRLLIEDALREAKVDCPIKFCCDGLELLDYLHECGAGTKTTTPGLLLLDLNMPRMDGREALKNIKQDPMLRRMPVVVLTTSNSEDDVFHAYDLGVNSFITKPANFQGLVDVMKSIAGYWLAIVALPDN